MREKTINWKNLLIDKTKPFLTLAILINIIIVVYIYYETVSINQMFILAICAASMLLIAEVLDWTVRRSNEYISWERSFDYRAWEFISNIFRSVGLIIAYLEFMIILFKLVSGTYYISFRIYHLFF